MVLVPPEFKSWPKMSRLFGKQIIITEKIDGTNAQIHFDNDMNMFVGSRSRWIYPEKGKDNYGFAAWCHENQEELKKLGHGTHYGEWWGQGIQRGYGMTDRFFSLFDTRKAEANCSVVRIVPTIYKGPYEHGIIDYHYKLFMESTGSYAAPGWYQPEGLVILFTENGARFKLLPGTAKGPAHKSEE